MRSFIRGVGQAKGDSSPLSGLERGETVSDRDGEQSRLRLYRSPAEFVLEVGRRGVVESPDLDRALDASRGAGGGLELCMGFRGGGERGRCGRGGGTAARGTGVVKVAYTMGGCGEAVRGYSGVRRSGGVDWRCGVLAWELWYMLAARYGGGGGSGECMRGCLESVLENWTILKLDKVEKRVRFVGGVRRELARVLRRVARGAFDGCWTIEGELCGGASGGDGREVTLTRAGGGLGLAELDWVTEDGEWCVVGGSELRELKWGEGRCGGRERQIGGLVSLEEGGSRVRGGIWWFGSNEFFEEQRDGIVESSGGGVDVVEACGLDGGRSEGRGVRVCGMSGEEQGGGAECDGDVVGGGGWAASGGVLKGAVGGGANCGDGGCMEDGARVGRGRFEGSGGGVEEGGPGSKRGGGVEGGGRGFGEGSVRRGCRGYFSSLEFEVELHRSRSERLERRVEGLSLSEERLLTEIERVRGGVSGEEAAEEDCDGCMRAVEQCLFEEEAVDEGEEGEREESYKEKYGYAKAKLVELHNALNMTLGMTRMVMVERREMERRGDEMGGGGRVEGCELCEELAERLVGREGGGEQRERGVEMGEGMGWLEAMGEGRGGAGAWRRGIWCLCGVVDHVEHCEALMRTWRARAMEIADRYAVSEAGWREESERRLEEWRSKERSFEKDRGAWLEREASYLAELGVLRGELEFERERLREAEAGSKSKAEVIDFLDQESRAQMEAWRVEHECAEGLRRELDVALEGEKRRSDRLEERLGRAKGVMIMLERKLMGRGGGTERGGVAERQVEGLEKGVGSSDGCVGIRGLWGEDGASVVELPALERGESSCGESKLALSHLVRLRLEALGLGLCGGRLERRELSGALSWVLLFPASFSLSVFWAPLLVLVLVFFVKRLNALQAQYELVLSVLASLGGAYSEAWSQLSRARADATRGLEELNVVCALIDGACDRVSSTVVASKGTKGVESVSRQKVRIAHQGGDEEDSEADLLCREGDSGLTGGAEPCCAPERGSNGASIFALLPDCVDVSSCSAGTLARLRSLASALEALLAEFAELGRRCAELTLSPLSPSEELKVKKLSISMLLQEIDRLKLLVEDGASDNKSNWAEAWYDNSYALKENGAFKQRSDIENVDSNVDVLKASMANGLARKNPLMSGGIGSLIDARLIHNSYREQSALMEDPSPATKGGDHYHPRLRCALVSDGFDSLDVRSSNFDLSDSNVSASSEFAYIYLTVMSSLDKQYNACRARFDYDLSIMRAEIDSMQLEINELQERDTEHSMTAYLASRDAAMYKTVCEQLQSQIDNLIQRHARELVLPGVPTGSPDDDPLLPTYEDFLTLELKYAALKTKLKEAESTTDHLLERIKHIERTHCEHFDQLHHVVRDYQSSVHRQLQISYVSQSKHHLLALALIRLQQQIEPQYKKKQYLELVYTLFSYLKAQVPPLF